LNLGLPVIHYKLLGYKIRDLYIRIFI